VLLGGVTGAEVQNWTDVKNGMTRGTKGGVKMTIKMADVAIASLSSPWGSHATIVRHSLWPVQIGHHLLLRTKLNPVHPRQFATVSKCSASNAVRSCRITDDQFTIRLAHKTNHT
jgi:hypothetical protein